MDWIDELMKRARYDPWYQECAADVAAKEPAFLIIRDALTAEQQDQLDSYIAACEQLKYSLVQIAYQMANP